jgi:hypothetical protein
MGPAGAVTFSAPSVAAGNAPGRTEKASVLRAKEEAERYRNAVEVARESKAAETDALRRRMQDAFGRSPKDGLEAAKPPAPLGRPGFTRLSPDEIARARVKDAVPHLPPLVVREYAAPRPGTQPGEDAPAGDTILWQPVVVLPSDGKATLELNLGSARGYQVIVAGHTLDGRIGAVRRILPVAEPGGPAFAPADAPAAPVAPTKP